jgi:sensor histidine kinase regulating citrate/malate metabolism
VKVAVAVVEAATTEEAEEEVLQRVASVAAAVAVAPAIRAVLPLPRRQQVVIQVTSEMPRDEPMVIMFQELV